MVPVALPERRAACCKITGMLRTARRKAAIFACLATALPALFGQGTATIHGTANDPQSQPVTGCVVTIENAVTGLKRSMTTGTDGRYSFINLPLQNYDLSFDANGFSVHRQSAALRTTVPQEINVTLRLADQITRMDVSAESTVLIDPGATGTRTELNVKAIERMPTSPNARGLESVLLTMPGFAANANGAIHPRGAHNQMTFVVDGMPISDQLTGAFANAVDPSVVESVDLFTGNVPSEFGNKVSAVAVVTTRTGIGSGGKFAGSTQIAADQFDTLANLTQFTGGTSKFGYFASFSASKSNRFLDSVSLDNLHNGGDAQRAFLRLDYQPGGRDIFRAGFMAGRSSFQLANLRSQHASLQNQRQNLEDVSASLQWIRTLNVRTTFEAQSSFRNAFADLLPSPGDTPVTASQSRRLTTWNVGGRLNKLVGSHTIRGGVDFQHFPLREHFTFAVTDPNFNSPGSEGFNPSLVPFDLTRGGGHFTFGETNAGSLYSAFLQDQWRLGRWQLSLGLRYDYYRFLVRGAQWQPRLGLSYHLKETGTVLRASYNRTYQTPPNENLLMSSSEASAVLAPPSVTEGLGNAFRYIYPERQNVYEAGLQQSLGKVGMLNATYYHKQSTDLQDNDNFFNTGIIFPTSLAKSRVNGAEGRVVLFPGKRFSATFSATHYHVVVTPPFTGGLFLGAAAIDALTAGPFVIDHDQVLGVASNVVYNFTRSLWTSATVRYDSGLVSNPSDPAEVAQDPDYFDQLPYVNLTSDPTRVNPRTIVDWAVGYAHTRGDGRRVWEAVLTLNNIGNATALYNFQSIFVGTRVVGPRSVGGRVRFYF